MDGWTKVENVKAVILKSPFQDLMLVGCGVKGERRGKHTGWMLGLGPRMADGSNRCARSMGEGLWRAEPSLAEVVLS